MAIANGLKRFRDTKNFNKEHTVLLRHCIFFITNFLQPLLF